MILFLLAMGLVVYLVQRLDAVECPPVPPPDPQPHQQPPIITLPEAAGYRFVSGSAELTAEFRELLEVKVLAELEAIRKAYQVDVIEVVGHTDGQTIWHEAGNLDSELEQVADDESESEITALRPGSNADLGLMRALSVVKFIQEYQDAGGLRNVQLRPYSAAQLLLPDGRFAEVDRQADAERRRIELRFTRSQGEGV